MAAVGEDSDLDGAEITHRTRRALLEAVTTRALEQLDSSIEVDKETNPFLEGVPAILDALRSRQIECRVYDRDKFHAKAYITHAKLEVVGSQALVGSSNFTRPGLTKNIELNIQVQSGREVAQLQEWFEAHWNEASEVTDAVIETISRHTHLYTPFDVYAKALQEFFRGHELTATEWDETRSRMFSKLDRYQKEAYWAVMKIARQHGGAFLCDGVGLGKTFVGLMLIERLVLDESKRVVLFAPKATKEGVWEAHLREWLPHIGGVGGNADFSNLAVFSHTGEMATHREADREGPHRPCPWPSAGSPGAAGPSPPTPPGSSRPDADRSSGASKGVINYAGSFARRRTLRTALPATSRRSPDQSTPMMS